MNNNRNKLALGLTTLMLLLTLAIGSAAPTLAVGNVDPTMDGLHGLLASPYDGGGSGT
jgi:hypothetical protein